MAEGKENPVLTGNSAGRNNPLVLNNELKTKIKQSKILVVGAGGIGCELLKNLVMTGFENIEIIDLDTIDVSNLNRQFLFHRRHVGMSKATVAKESVLKFKPNANIVAHHASVTSPSFGVNYISQFNIVMNALDNMAARNHVNRLCLAANVPLIESGTAGYFGQVELISKGLTSCYECTPKPTQKSYPGCTIRNTPSELIHCIVWAKHLFNQLFGENDPNDEDQDVSPDPNDEEIGDPSAGDDKKPKITTREWAKKIDYDGPKLFNKLFDKDIEVLLSMKKLWETRRKPVPLVIEEAKKLTTVVEEENSTLKMNDQRLWPISKWVDVFLECLQGLRASLNEAEHGYLLWDKDDKPAMEFVAAAANIRAQIFGINQKSLFEIKSMAGNIIPAIATSNAIIAGLIVLNAVNVVRGQLQQCQSVYLKEFPGPRGFLISRENELAARNENCTACRGTRPTVYIATDLTKMKVKDFESLILKERFNMAEPEVIFVRTGNIILTSEEGVCESLKEMTLSEIGITCGSMLEADDFVQSYQILFVLEHREIRREDPPFTVLNISGPLNKPGEENGETPRTENGQNGSSHETPEPGPSKEEDKTNTIEDDDEDCVMIIDGAEETRKRKLEDTPVPVKKRKGDTTEEK